MDGVSDSRMGNGLGSDKVQWERIFGKTGFEPKNRTVDLAKGKSFGEKVRWVDKEGNPLPEKSMLHFGAKRLTGGWNSLSVWLLPDGKTVEKRYGPGVDRKERMEMEIKILERLKDCEFVPKLLDVDRKHRIVRMTYCGTKVKESLRLRKILNQLLRTLEDKYGVYRKSNVGRRFYQLVDVRNVTSDGNRIYIIDFGSDNWLMKPTSEPATIPVVTNPTSSQPPSASSAAIPNKKIT